VTRTPDRVSRHIAASDAGTGASQFSYQERQTRLIWFGHVERMGDVDDWVKCCTMEADGRETGRPRMVWKGPCQVS